MIPLPFKFNLRTKFILLIGIIVTASITIIFYWMFRESKKDILNQVDTQAKALFKQIVITRQWIADRGGLYILKDHGVKSHPLLSQYDIKDDKGVPYAFRNPAMVTRELSEYSEGAKLYSFRLTSLRPKNPENAPSAFEKKSLQTFEKKGFDKWKDGLAQTITGKNKKTFFQRIFPLQTQKACLSCHADQGYKEGDIQGGISVTIPLDNALKAVEKSRALLITSGIVFVLIISGVLYFVVWLLVLKPVGHLHDVTKKYDLGEDIGQTYLSTGDEFEDLSRSFRDMLLRIKESYKGSVKTLAYAIEARSPYTKGHIDRVARYCIAIAKELSMKDKEIEALEMGAVLHDVGKIGIPDIVLQKPVCLTEEEYNSMSKHAEIGANILLSSNFLLREVPAVLFHHERFDGTGYPSKLRGTDIPLIARIISVADTFDAITTDRPYSKAKDFEAACSEIEKGSGTQFDPDVVKALKKAYEKGHLDLKVP